jgi:hypothetical protein
MPITNDNNGQQNRDKIRSLAIDSNNVLCVVRSVFPFQLFPSILTVEKTKVVHTQNYLFGSYSESIIIANIATVMIQTSFFLSAIEIRNKAAAAPPLNITHLPTAQAKEAVDLIRGLMVSYETNADLTKIPSPELAESIQKIGNTKTI